MKIQIVYEDAKHVKRCLMNSIDATSVTIEVIRKDGSIDEIKLRETKE